MPTRKQVSRSEEKTGKLAAVKSNRGKRLRRAAQNTLFVAGMTVTRLMAEADFAEMKLFSPGLVDRLQEPISRIRE